MRTYGLTLILSPLLQEQEVYETMQTIASFIQEKGGILGNQDIKGKRPLLAPVNKHKEGYLAVLDFTVSAEHIEQLEKLCRGNAHVLRFLLFWQRKKAAKPEPAPVLAQPGKAQEEKMDLQDIDEKLEEIFKEQI